MEIELGVTTTNPNDDNSQRLIKVRLHSTGQEVDAVVGYSIEHDLREQNPNIKIGTEVMCLLDKRNNYYAIASTSQGIELTPDKNYNIENEKEVTIKTKSLKVSAVDGTNSDLVDMKTSKISIANDNEELMSLLSELIDEVVALKTIGNLSAPCPVSPATIAILNALKARLETFKV